MTHLQVSNHLENLSFNKANCVLVEKWVKTAKEHFKTVASDSYATAPQAPEHGTTIMLSCPGRLAPGSGRSANSGADLLEVGA